jgi:hypothetical protein
MKTTHLIISTADFDLSVTIFLVTFVIPVKATISSATVQLLENNIITFDVLNGF